MFDQSLHCLPELRVRKLFNQHLHDFSDVVQARRDELLRKTPSASKKQPSTLAGVLGMGLVAPTEEDIKEYKNDVEKYCRRYEAFLTSSWEYEKWWAQSFLLILSFANK